MLFTYRSQHLLRIFADYVSDTLLRRRYVSRASAVFRLYRYNRIRRVSLSVGFRGVTPVGTPSRRRVTSLATHRWLTPSAASSLSAVSLQPADGEPSRPHRSAPLRSDVSRSLAGASLRFTHCEPAACPSSCRTPSGRRAGLLLPGTSLSALGLSVPDLTSIISRLASSENLMRTARE